MRLDIRTRREPLLYCYLIQNDRHAVVNVENLRRSAARDDGKHGVGLTLFPTEDAGHVHHLLTRNLYALLMFNNRIDCEIHFL